jgi:hypothetical protein
MHVKIMFLDFMFFWPCLIGWVAVFYVGQRVDCNPFRFYTFYIIKHHAFLTGRNYFEDFLRPTLYAL